MNGKKLSAGLWVLWLLLALVAVSCDDEEETEDKCSVSNNSGCADGMVCLEGPDGDPDCYCSAEDNSGCEDGLECQPVEGEQPGCFCSPGGQTGCLEGEVCERVIDGNNGCFPPVTVRGLVFDLATGDPIEGAHVAARDANFAAVSDVAVTDESGNYELTVLTARNEDGSLAENQVALRADAEGYLTFPRPPRVALPFDTAAASGDPLVLESSATEVGLIPLESTTGLGSISGTVLTDGATGTLIVAGGQVEQGGGVTGLAGFDGTYTVFNVPEGTVSVKGYKAGLQLESTSADVTAGETTEGVDLALLGEATAVVSGKVEIVNPGDGDDTSIILVVDETFIENAAIGEAPPGLRVGEISGQWSIPNVPDGNYVVLAAFENDFLVRDPDTSIGGTELVRITVSEGDLDISEGFKITGALDVVSPDAEETVSGTPTFIWGDDSSEDHYEIVVYDVYGNLIWEDLAVPGVSGSSTVEVSYGGPTLESGLLYQFRATSIKNNGTPIARTEDLRGVFLYQ
ncbi:MAG: carboxypeptidase regulatory-like domain-containing protein [Deltaproteobacteria bacterium]|nr:carboxypeptidase regulatory-like domain-containing protein [Deltaproteobacteria bacterium]